MKIYALIGKSGTGKSFQAPNLAEKYKIESIIDDGLFIMKGSVLAGTSAKRQSTKIRAIKTALFNEDDHRDKVKAAINIAAPNSILIVGTSDRMIDQIVERLDLGEPDERIYIEEITSDAERQEADKQRNELGKHIIPAPTMQVKKDFSGYFLHPIKAIRDINIGRSDSSERSVVRPTYSYLGGYTISDTAINDIIIGIGNRTTGVSYIDDIYVKNRKEGVTLEVSLILDSVPLILTAAREFQMQVAKKIEEMTALNIIGVNVFIKGLI